MRNTLEELYFGKITPNEQDITPGSVLADAMERAEQCEERLTTLLEGEEKTLLLRLLNAENEIGSTLALENLGMPRSRSAWIICRTSRSVLPVSFTRSRRWRPCPAPASRNWEINPACTRSWLVVLWERENFWSLAVAVVSSARLAVPPAGRVFPFLGIHFHRLSALFVQLLSESFDVHKKARA